jgi:hypothetical protein
MMSDSSWEWIKRVGTITSLTGAAIGVGFFFFNQNQRISTLEAQMQAATITTTLRSVPAPARTDAPEKSGSSSDRATSAIVDVNPIVQACADMARQIAAKGTAIGALDPINSAMSAIGCAKVGNQ